MASQFVRSSAVAHGRPLSTNRTNGTVQVTFRGKERKDGTRSPDRTYLYSGGMDSEFLSWVDAMAREVERGTVSIGRDVLPSVKERATDVVEVTA